MEEKKCSCHHSTECAACPGEPLYWCETCQRAVADKRCSYCGLKTRQRGPQDTSTKK